MLASHLNAIEAVLVAQGKVASNARHPNLIGGPKEWFIRNFLAEHLPSTVRIGQGEIINAQSKPRPVSKCYSNQVDIILYRHDFPKIVYGEGDYAFLEESVIATIEVKSSLEKKQDGVEKACRASLFHKNLQVIREYDKQHPQEPVGHFIRHDHPPYMYSYLVAFDGPKNISTVASWLPKITERLETTPDRLVDMIVVLGKGVVWRIDAFRRLKSKSEKTFAGHNWAFLEQEDKNLLLLFLHMLDQMTYESIPIDVLGYARGISFAEVSAI